MEFAKPKNDAISTLCLFKRNHMFMRFDNDDNGLLDEGVQV
jgi:hypothetical protein